MPGEQREKEPDRVVNKKIEVVIITGLSGAGKTNAVDWFEDRGYYCVDNMPPSLIMNFIDLSIASRKVIDRAVFVADVRGGQFFDDLKETILRLRKNDLIDVKLLFIEASALSLVKRYNETRRLHPLTNGPATREVILRETEVLREIRNMSEYIIDTTQMKVSDLKTEMSRLFEGGKQTFAVNITSFGYKHGLPIEADIAVDLRFIPNPYYVKSLKHLTGNNKKVASYVFGKKVTKDFCADFLAMIDKLVPAYRKEEKYHLNIAFGCTGGQHRSVAVADRMADEMRRRGYRVTLEHRDL